VCWLRLTAGEESAVATRESRPECAIDRPWLVRPPGTRLAPAVEDAEDIGARLILIYGGSSDRLVLLFQ
jgi:hypothetical protein